MLAHPLPSDICSVVPGSFNPQSLLVCRELSLSGKSQTTGKIGQSARSVAALHYTQSQNISRHIHCGGEGRQALVGSGVGCGLRSSVRMMIIWDSMIHNVEKLLDEYTEWFHQPTITWQVAMKLVGQSVTLFSNAFHWKFEWTIIYAEILSWT